MNWLLKSKRIKSKIIKKLVLCLSLVVLVLWMIMVPVTSHIYLGSWTQQAKCHHERLVHGIRQQFLQRYKFSVPCSLHVQDSIVRMHHRDSSLVQPLNTSLQSLDCSFPDDEKTLKKNPCSLEWITSATVCSTALNTLAESISKSDIDFTINGHGSLWLGFGRRIRLFRDYLSTLPRSKIVLYTDGDDIGFLPSDSCSSQNLLKTFYSHDTPILFMAESTCWPDPLREFEYPKPSSYTPSPFLNAGGYMGYVWALIELIDSAYEYDCMDDQRGFTTQFLSKLSYFPLANNTRVITSRTRYPELLDLSKPLIKLDYYNSIFQSLYSYDLKDFDVSLRSTSFINTNHTLNHFVTKRKSRIQITNTKTGGSPCIFHQNGPKEPPLLWNQLVHVMQSLEPLL